MKKTEPDGNRPKTSNHFEFIPSRAFQDMPQIQFVNRNKIFNRHGVFLDVQQAGSPEIHDAKPFQQAYNFSDAVILWAGAIVDEVSQLDIVMRAPMVRINYR